MTDKNTLSRRDLIKGAAMGVGAALLPAAAVPRLTKASVDGVGTVAATKEALAPADPISILKTAQAEYFSPMVIDSSIECVNDIIEFPGMNGPNYIPSMTRITGSFTMYIENAAQAESLHKFMRQQEAIKLKLAQGPFDYWMDAYVTNVTINASAHDLMTADVGFVTGSVEVVET